MTFWTSYEIGWNRVHTALNVNSADLFLVRESGFLYCISWSNLTPASPERGTININSDSLHEKDVLFFCDSQQLVELFHVEREWFLTQNILARQQGSLGVGMMVSVRRSYVDHIHILLSVPHSPPFPFPLCSSLALLPIHLAFFQRYPAIIFEARPKTRKRKVAKYTHRVIVHFFICPIPLDSLQTPILHTPLGGVFARFQLGDKFFGRLGRSRSDRGNLVENISGITGERVDKEVLGSARCFSCPFPWHP